MGRAVIEKFLTVRLCAEAFKGAQQFLYLLRRKNWKFMCSLHWPIGVCEKNKYRVDLLLFRSVFRCRRRQMPRRHTTKNIPLGGFGIYDTADTWAATKTKQKKKTMRSRLKRVHGWLLCMGCWAFCSADNAMMAIIHVNECVVFRSTLFSDCVYYFRRFIIYFPSNLFAVSHTAVDFMDLCQSLYFFLFFFFYARFPCRSRL